jgi:hypothetical protein
MEFPFFCTTSLQGDGWHVTLSLRDEIDPIHAPVCEQALPGEERLLL